jgi:hypothetical protein
VISDSNEALKLDPVYVKAINRRAQAYEKENQLNDALYGKWWVGRNERVTEAFLL